MPAVIQIAIAGALLLAWIWVLGRPLMASRRRTPYEEFLAANPDRVPAATPSDDASELPEVVEADYDLFGGDGPLDRLQRWWRRPAHVWRRQLLLATMIATFVSFFLAVALRSSLGNTFVYLFGLMVLGLLIHLAIAAYLGSQMVAANRTVRVRQAQSQVRPGGMSIKAGRVADDGAEGRRILQDDHDVALFEFDEHGEDAFNLAADIASALDADEQRGTIDQVAEVNEMIESAWADDDPAYEAETGAGHEHGYGDGDESPSATEPEPQPESAAEPILDDDGEAIFRRAAKDEPARPRRKPRAIYIESQLDDDDEDGDGQKAVNYP